MNLNPRDAENDRHGFALYAVFAIAGSAQVSAISELRRAMYSGVEDPPAYVNAPAHVTVKRLFAGIVHALNALSRVDQLIARLRQNLARS